MFPTSGFWAWNRETLMAGYFRFMDDMASHSVNKPISPFTAKRCC